MKKRGSTILLILVFLVGMSLLLYPTLSDAWNRRHQSRAITAYSQKISGMEDDSCEKIREAARIYNSEIELGTISPLDDARTAVYKQQLDPTGTGIMGYVEIPKIQCSLPIYHGTKDTTLLAAVGHLEWSGLPVGGEGTHCVLSGHRGLPSAMLFTRLDEMQEGDHFLLQVLDETLTYEVDQILIVEPENVDSLTAVAGKDYCTLVTCTPYGINTHRLLVRGHRVENEEEEIIHHVTAEAAIIRPLIVAPFVAVPLLLLLLPWLIVHDKRKTKKKKRSIRRKEEEGS